MNTATVTVRFFALVNGCKVIFRSLEMAKRFSDKVGIIIYKESV